MAIDEQHVALPKLYGAPAYARPPRPSADTPRPFDPDELPIEAVQTDEERDLLPTVPHAEGHGRRRLARAASQAAQPAGPRWPPPRPRFERRSLRQLTAGRPEPDVRPAPEGSRGSIAAGE